MAISSEPKKSFWKPPDEPGWTMQATEGVLRPATQQLHVPQGSLTQTVPLPRWFSLASLGWQERRLRIQQRPGRGSECAQRQAKADHSVYVLDTGTG